MIDWEAVRRRMQFESQEALWETLYVKQELSIETLSRRFGVSVTAIRSQLLRHRLPIRPARRNAPRRSLLPPNIVALVREAGSIKKVADGLHLPYGLVYRHLRRLALARLKRLKAQSQAAATRRT